MTVPAIRHEIYKYHVVMNQDSHIHAYGYTINLMQVVTGYMHQVFNYKNKIVTVKTIFPLRR
jgi:hypothetical protein